jgi:hypothetical protein
MALTTVLLAAIIIILLFFILLVSIKPSLISKNNVIGIFSFLILTGLAVFLFSGTRDFSHDIGKIIKKSGPKSPETIYSILFGMPADNCVTTINLKDQVVPILDCCIWIELNLCPNELERILETKKFEVSSYSAADSVNFASSFSDKPAWWNPQNLGDSILKFTFKRDQNHVQTIFSGTDSTHVFICDLAN